MVKAGKAVKYLSLLSTFWIILTPELREYLIFHSQTQGPVRKK